MARPVRDRRPTNIPQRLGSLGAGDPSADAPERVDRRGKRVHRTARIDEAAQIEQLIGTAFAPQGHRAIVMPDHRIGPVCEVIPEDVARELRIVRPRSLEELELAAPTAARCST